MADKVVLEINFTLQTHIFILLYEKSGDIKPSFKFLLPVDTRLSRKTFNFEHLIERIKCDTNSTV